MNKIPAIVIAVLFSLLAISLPAHADNPPAISGSLKKMLGELPIAGLKGEVDTLIASLKKSSCGGSLTGCYATKTTLNVPNLGQVPLQLYFFSSQNTQQTFLLVINSSIVMPTLLKDKAQKLLAGTALTDPMISISTVDYTLDTRFMPVDLQNIVRASYFNVDALDFSSGIQIASKARIGGAMKDVIQKTMGLPVDDFTMRAAVVLPIPTDLAGGAGTGIGLAQSLRESKTLTDSVKEAAMPEAFVEFQMAPNKTFSEMLGMDTGVILSDATFFLNNAGTVGYKGNLTIPGVKARKIITFFKTPLAPSGAMDLLDFEFGLAMPRTFTLEDYANTAVTFASNKVPNGGFIKNINQYKQALFTVTKPLSVFQLINPQPPANEYKFGDRNKPFPTVDKFNVVLLGPLASHGDTNGPLLKVQGNVRILGQQMGSMNIIAGGSGFVGVATADLLFKMGPLGKQGIRMTANVDVSGRQQLIGMKGNVLGRVLELALDGNELTINSPATCATPFEIKARAAIDESMDVAQILDLQGGVNVDPAQLQNCIGKDLEAALNWVMTTGKYLGGYSANQAGAALNQIQNAAREAAEVTARQAQEEADRAYQATKDAARNLANSSTNSATNAFRDMGNAFKGLGGKSSKGGSDKRLDPAVFDWDYYYDRYPELRNTDLVTHWRDQGFNASLRGSLEFDLEFYRRNHPTPNNGDLLNHWLKDGINGCQEGSAEFSARVYMERYSDLKEAFRRDKYPCRSALAHWLAGGRDNEHRNGSW